MATDGEHKEMQKSIEQLQTQWAGGIDVWPNVPTQILIGKEELDMKFESVQNRVLREDEMDSMPSSSKWPVVVRHSILFGFGAYNPRGQDYPNDVNEAQHARLHSDIKDGLSYFKPGLVTYWEGASIWEDGSSEKGFVIAVSNEASVQELEKGYKWIIQLATKYDQGAIYRFDFLAGGEDTTNNLNIGKLLRTTVPVLDPGTSAKVQVIRDDNIDLTPFLNLTDSHKS